MGVKGFRGLLRGQVNPREVLRIVTNYTSPAGGPGSDDAQQDIHSLLVRSTCLRMKDPHLKSQTQLERYVMRLFLLCISLTIGI